MISVVFVTELLEIHEGCFLNAQCVINTILDYIGLYWTIYVLKGIKIYKLYFSTRKHTQALYIYVYIYMCVYVCVAVSVFVCMYKHLSKTKKYITNSSRCLINAIEKYSLKIYLIY